MVIRGGENLYPREVEELLHTHPAIAEVQIFGVPDETYGEELCAWIRTWYGWSHIEIEWFNISRSGKLVSHFDLTSPSSSPYLRCETVLQGPLPRNSRGDPGLVSCSNQQAQNPPVHSVRDIIPPNTEWQAPKIHHAKASN